MTEVLTEIVKLVLEKPISLAYKEIMYVKDLDSHTKDLRDTLATIEATLLDANSLGSCSRSQQNVLGKLGCALARLENFFDAEATRAKQRELHGRSKLVTEVFTFFSPSNQVLARLKNTKKVKGIRDELDFIAKNYAQFGTIFNMLSEKKPQTLSLETGPRPKSDVFIGRDKDIDNLIAMVCNSTNGQESLSVIPIVGIGGQGKTTLAQYVYNHETVIGCFDVRLWVFATPDISVREILEKAIACAMDDKPLNCEMSQLQFRILQAIEGKKFLLVLDNIWDQDNLRANWEELRALIEKGDNGSKVLVTTRSESVARILGPLDPYMLNDLADFDSWLLFKHFAFTQRQELGVETIGKEIVKMCPKVPLVLRVVGQHLANSRTIEEWQAFKNELATKSSFKGRNMIIETLKLSYDQLDEKLKLCVAYCSLFPKDTRFDMELMVHLWIALGYVESQYHNLEDVGEEYARCLVSRGFFHYEFDDEKKYFMMHDVIHDLIVSITQSKYQMMANLRSNKIDERACHASFSRPYRIFFSEKKKPHNIWISYFQ